MRLDVYLGAQQLAPSDVHGRVVVVIDVLRASTTIAAALFHGARAVVPLESSEEVVTRARNFARGDVLMAGERRMMPISGFDLGNSPAEYTRDVVEGKTVLLTTTNGTAAFASVQGARDVVVGSYVNYSAVLAMVRAAARGAADVSIVCAGSERQFSLEDAACAGRFVRGVTRRLANVQMNDAALACSMLDRRYGDHPERVFAEATHGKALVAAGFAGDLEICARVDAYPVLPIYSDRQVTKLGPDRER